MSKKMALYVVLAVSALFFVVRPTCAQYYMMESPLVGEKAPVFQLKDLSSDTKDFAQLSSGKDTILFFWATWCPHCRKQLRELSEKAGQLKAEKIELVLVDLGENAVSVKAYLQKNKIDLPVLLDEAGNVSENYGVVGVPTFIFVDKSGVVRSIEHYLPDDYKTFFLVEQKD